MAPLPASTSVVGGVSLPSLLYHPSDEVEEAAAAAEEEEGNLPCTLSHQLRIDSMMARLKDAIFK